MSIKKLSHRKSDTFSQLLRFLNNKKSGIKVLEMRNTNDLEASKTYLTCSELFNSILRDKVPAYKNKSEAFLIINRPTETMLHPIFDVNIDEYVLNVLTSYPYADSRLKPLFAVVTGTGRGKTRMLVEMQNKLNESPNVFCLALTFNNYWIKILDLPVSQLKSLFPKEYQYAINIVARIISMNYYISFHSASSLLIPSLKNIDVESLDPSDLIHECVKYIIRQYRVNGQKIDQLVVLVDESVEIENKLDVDDKKDIHQTLRECLLTNPIVFEDGMHLKVDLVMSG